MKSWYLLVLLFAVNLYGQESVRSMDSIVGLPEYSAYANTEPNITLSGPWKFMKGDNPAWAASSFDDRSWQELVPNLEALNASPGIFGNIGWFRTRVYVGPEHAGEVLALMMTQSGASEIYIDGKLVHKFGTINTADPSQEDRFDPQFLPAHVIFDTAGIHVIAVRYANARAEDDVASGKAKAPGFQVNVGKMWANNVYRFVNSNILTAIFTFYFTFFIALSFLHMVIFLFYRAKRSNLYYSIFAAGFGLVFLCLLSRQNVMIPDLSVATNYMNMFLSNIYAPALIAMLYTIFYGRLLKIFWVWLGLYALDFIFTLFNVRIPYFDLLTFSLFCVESIRVIVAAMIKKRDGAWVIGSAIIITAVFLLGFVFLAAAGQAEIIYTQRGWMGAVVGLVTVYLTLSIPLHMSIYLARDFARTNKNLQRKLEEVEELSAKSVQQEKEKQKILAEQNDMLEAQVKERTAEIVEQKKVIEEKNKDITDSIRYAKKIQDAMLPEHEFVAQLFPENFILFRPKDIVSGDFYWIANENGYRFIAVADCTGHGVPGALMSMTGDNLLNQMVIERKLESPASILNELDVAVRKSLKQDRSGTESKDGMDVALCRFNADGRELVYAGANRPLWIVRSGGLLEFKAFKQSIGGLHPEGSNFREEKISLQKNDMIYLLSDGYADQFGGPQGKKFMSRKLKELLTSIANDKLSEQKAILDARLDEWRGELTQVDDILVIGIRIT